MLRDPKGEIEVYLDLTFLLFLLYIQHTVTVVSSSHKPHHSVWSTNCISDGASLHDESLTLRFVLWCQF